MSYPHVGHGGGRVEELADNVGGGGDAEDDRAEDFLPPGQKQYRVLSPATVGPHLVSFYQAHGAVALPSVTLAIGEVVTVVWREKGKVHSSYRVFFQTLGRLCKMQILILRF